MSPNSQTLTMAFLVTQFFLLLIVYSGIFALRIGERRLSPFSENPRFAIRRLPFLVLGFSLITLACLAFSQDFVSLFRPAFGDVDFPAIPRNSAFSIVFFGDIVGAGLLMGFTGGSKDSPFSAVLFALPALAIFLRESPTRFFSYTFIAVALFILFSRPNNLYRQAVLENSTLVVAFQLVTLGCLALSSLVGYATRPS